MSVSLKSEYAEGALGILWNVDSDSLALGGACD